MAAELLARSTLRDKAQTTVPPEVRRALLVEGGDEIEWRIDAETGEVTVVGLKTIPADQAWFWTPEWQAGEAEATADIAAGQTTRYATADEFLDSLND